MNSPNLFSLSKFSGNQPKEADRNPIVLQSSLQWNYVWQSLFPTVPLTFDVPMSRHYWELTLKFKYKYKVGSKIGFCIMIDTEENMIWVGCEKTWVSSSLMICTVRNQFKWLWNRDWISKMNYNPFPFEKWSVCMCAFVKHVNWGYTHIQHTSTGDVPAIGDIPNSKKVLKLSKEGCSTSLEGARIHY